MSAACPGLFSGLVHFAFNKHDFWGGLFVCLFKDLQCNSSFFGLRVRVACGSLGDQTGLSKRIINIMINIFKVFTTIMIITSSAVLAVVAVTAQW